MNKNILIGIALAMFVALFMQDSLSAQADTTKYWMTKGNVGLTFSQISFANWAKGGENSVSGNSFLNFYADYKKDKVAWNNYLLLSYGLLQQGESGKIRKTDDRIDLNSKLGWEQWSNLYWTFLMNFKTQFTKGYNYPNDSVYISKFLTPAYLILSLGGDYKPTDYLSIYLSPATGRFTYVSDTMLSKNWGVDPGKTIRPEFGWYLTAVFKKDNLIENVSVSSKINLFQNYTDKNPDNRMNIDVDWEFLTLFKINSFLSANFKFQLIYDHDIKIPNATGPRTQFMEQFGLGIVFNLL
jgi:hypothetical protein